jgi:hypothetical protein
MSNYPERPARGKRPPRPGILRKKASSEHISGKRKAFFVKAVAAEPGGKLRESYDKLAFAVAGHSNPAAVKFFKDYRHNHVPVHVWGKKGRVALAA